MPIPFILAIDNGVTGFYTVLSSNGELVEHKRIPTKKCINYTKKEQNITRIDVGKLKQVLQQYTNCVAVLERPLVNPGMFKATCSALRSFEATLIALEQCSITLGGVVDSKQWQHKMLPGDVSGEALKVAATKIAKEKFPSAKVVEGDSVLMALWWRKTLTEPKTETL